ncbi:MAG: acyl-CoA dehydrogenase family protein [Candidatus Korobacteraceae bacterium]|jgi:butyryl-CoA dehydrogenase
MNFELTEEQQLIGQSARDFAKEYLEPIAVELDHSGEFPKEAVKALAKHDFLGLLLPDDVGGAAAGFVSYVEVIEDLSRYSAAVASIVNNHMIAAYSIQQWGTADQKKQYLPGMAKGEILGGFAIYEHGPTPGVGADALVATKHDVGYVLNGKKAYVRNAGEASVYVVFATTDAAAGEKTWAAFLLPADAVGVKVGEKLETMGLRGCPVADITFENVILPETALLGTVNQGVAISAKALAIASVAEAAQTVGIGQAAVEHAAAYAKQRVQFGKPVATLQAIQTLLAEVATDCHLARLGLRNAALLIEEGKPFEVEAAMVKSFLVRLGSKMLIDTCQVEGGFGYSESMPLPRMFRDIAGTNLLDAPGDFPEKLIAASIA